MSNRLGNEQQLQAGQQLVSSNSLCTFDVQADGNLVIYYKSRALWASNTSGQPLDHLRMQADGNIVAYPGPENHDATWVSSSNGKGSGPYTLNMQDDGNLVAYDKDNVPIWASMSLVPVKFRFFKFKNDGRGVLCRPMIKDASNSQDIWVGDGDYWAVTDGMEKMVDVKHDRFDYGDSGPSIADKGGLGGKELYLGAFVKWGDDDWVINTRFEYDPDSRTVVRIRKYGGPRDGDCAFDGAES